MQAITAPITMAVPAAPAHWLRSRRFDLAFIVGTAALGIAAGGAGVVDRRVIAFVLLADIWLLGYPHVVATYTRLCFDRESFRAHRGLVTWLPIVIIAGTIGVFTAFGFWALTTIYFYWQWWHYTRQSWGVAQVYRRKAGAAAIGPERLYQAAFFLLPLWGILHRSHQAQTTFLGAPIRWIPVPEIVVTVVAAASIVALVAFAATRVTAWLRGELPLAHTAYLASHVAVFAVGYLLIPGVTSGWIALNVWHNAQYLLFVWHFNNKRYADGVQPSAPFLSTISQTQHIGLYALACFAISTVAYSLLPLVVPMLILSHAINFHHYVVDAVIWKVRRRPLQETLGLTSPTA